MKRSGGWLLLLAGVVAAALAYVLVSSLVGQRSGYWRAEASAAVLPANADPTYDAIYYETLSNGQLVRTLAEVVKAATPPAAAPRTTRTVGPAVEVRTLPDTSVIVLSSEGPSPEVVETAVRDQLVAGTASITALGIPYRLDVLADGVGTSELVEAAPLTQQAVALGAAIAALLAVIGGVPWMRRQLSM